MHKTVAEMLAEHTIMALHMTYCRAVDRCDFELLRSVFHPDARFDYGNFDGDVDGFLAMVAGGLACYLGTTHCVGNQLVELAPDGRSAWAEHYTVATHRIAADDRKPLRDFVLSIRYVDRVECRAGDSGDDWRITHRTLIRDWWRTDPVVVSSEPRVPSTARRDRDDPSCRLRTGL